MNHTNKIEARVSEENGQHAGKSEELPWQNPDGVTPTPAKIWVRYFAMKWRNCMICRANATSRSTKYIATKAAKNCLKDALWWRHYRERENGQ